MKHTTQERTRRPAVCTSATAATFVLLILLALPPAAAGGPDDPEIHDREGDTAPFTSTTEDAADALDVTAVWFDGTNETFTAVWQLAKLTASGSTDRFEYRLTFSVNSTRVDVEAWRQSSDSRMDAGVWVDGGVYPCAHTIPSGPWSEGRVKFDDSASRIEITFPRQCEGEDSSLDVAPDANITKPRAVTGHCTIVPINSCVTYTRVDETPEGRSFSFTQHLQSSEAGTDAALDIAPAGKASADGLLLPTVLIGLVAAAAVTQSSRRR